MNRYSGKSMIRLPMLAGAATLAGLLQTAATPAAAAQADKASMSSSTTAGDVKREWAEALEAIKGYSADQRDKALEKADTLINAMDSRIETLEDRTQEEWKDLSKDARAKRKAIAKKMRQQRAELSEWYGGMKHSTGEAWNEVKSGFVDAYDALGTSFSDAAKEF